MNRIQIRAEQPGDVPSITRVTELAFKTHPHSEHTEHFITLALRKAGALSVSLVAEQDARILVGHVAFSPVQISDGSRQWYGLGPIAVLPSWQRQGIGTSLISDGLSSLRSLGAAGCVVLGDPHYYSRFGFRVQPGCVFEGAPREYFQSLAFGPAFAVGEVTYHEAFSASGREPRRKRDQAP